MNDKASPRSPLAIIEADLREREHVKIFGNSYLIKHREDLGFSDLVRLDAIYSGYGHLMTKATGGKLDEMTDEEADSLEQPMRELVAMFLEGITPSVIAALKPQHLVVLMFAFTAALGTRPPAPTPNRETRRQTKPRSNGTRSSRPSSASTVATRGRGPKPAASA